MDDDKRAALALYVGSFGLYLRALNRSQNTVDTYSWAVNKLIDWLVEHTDVRAWPQVTRRHLQAFLADQLAAGAKPASVSVAYRAIQQYFKWLSSPEEGEIDANPMAGMQPPTVPPQPVPVPDAAKVAELLRGLSGRDFTSRRDAAIVALLVDTGMRRAELAGITVDDLDMARREVTVLGKGRKTRTVKFGRRAAVIVDRYLRARATSAWAHRPELWLGEKNRGVLSGSGIYQMIERRADQAGLGRLTPHQFRHLFAHLWLEAGGEEGDLMALLGWSSRSMVDRYAAEKRSQRARGAHDRLGVLDRLDR